MSKAISNFFSESLIGLSDVLQIGVGVLDLYNLKGQLEISNSFKAGQKATSDFIVRYNAKVDAFNLHNAFLTARKNQAILQTALASQPVASSYNTATVSSFSRMSLIGAFLDE